MTNPDVSGMLRFVTDELQEAEDAGERGRLGPLDQQFFSLKRPVISVDHGPCAQRLGWHEPLAQPDQLV